MDSCLRGPTQEERAVRSLSEETQKGGDHQCKEEDGQTDKLRSILRGKRRSFFSGEH